MATPLPDAGPETTTEGLTAAARLRTSHQRDAGTLQLAGDRLTAMIGSPRFVALLCITIPVWIAANLAVQATGLQPFDPPPFVILQTFAAISALVIAGLILMTQRHEDRLVDQRAQLILELLIANDQKIAKIIELLEESRRDNPALRNRVDAEASAMSAPSDTDAVLTAIKQLREDDA